MKFVELTTDEQQNVKDRAIRFWYEHKRHVNGLMDDRVPSVAPSGSDMNHPELWKPIHWNWFFDHYAEELT